MGKTGINERIERLSLAEIKRRHEAGTLRGCFLTTSEDYHRAPGISRTDLHNFATAPAKFRHYRENPSEPTPSMIKGWRTHLAILEPEEFDNQIAVAPPDLTRRGTKAWQAFEASEAAGRDIMKATEFEALESMINAVKAHSRFKALQGLHELSFWWKDPTTGMLCKCRPDNITPKGLLVDFKTAKLCYPERVWAREMFKHWYHVQAPFYVDGVIHALDQAGQTDLLPPIRQGFLFFTVETEAPHLIKPWAIGPHTMELGRRTYKETLERIRACEETGVWDGYPPQIETVECPEYAWEEEVEDDEVEDFPSEGGENE